MFSELSVGNIRGPNYGSATLRYLSPKGSSPLRAPFFVVRGGLSASWKNYFQKVYVFDRSCR